MHWVSLMGVGGWGVGGGGGVVVGGGGGGSGVEVGVGCWGAGGITVDAVCPVSF